MQLSSTAKAGEIATVGLRREQFLADEFSWSNSARAGEQSAARVRRELIQHVEFRHLREYLDKTLARVALIADEEQPSIIFHALTPGGPALCRISDAVIVGIRAPEDPRVVIALGSGKTHM